MTAIRQHEVLLAEGTFRVVATTGNRVIVAIDAPHTALGAMHIVIEVDRGIPAHVLERQALAQRGRAPHVQVAGFFDDVGRFISKAAETTFNTVSKAATTIARPIFKATTGAISQIMKGISDVTPFLPAKARNDIARAARTVASATLGDLNAKQFIRAMAQAAKAGVAGARKIGDALLDGTRLVARILDVPVQLLGKIPVVGDAVKFLSPFQRFDKMAGALQRGDLRAIGEMLKSDLRTAQGVLSMIPGIGTGISSGLSAGLSALEGGNPIEVAIQAAYGAIPIPPGVRQVTDVVLATVLELVKKGDLQASALAGARSKIPPGLPREVFDTLVQLVVKQAPARRAARPARRVDPRLASMQHLALPVGGASRVIDWRSAFASPQMLGRGGQPVQLRPIFRRVAVAGEEPLYMVGAEDPIAYAIAGEDFEVAGDGPIARYEVSGDDPSAYAVAGEDFEVGADEPIARYEVSGDDPPAYAVAGEEPVAVGGEDELAFATGGEDIETGGIPPQELLARLPHESEWRTMQTHLAPGRS